VAQHTEKEEMNGVSKDYYREGSIPEIRLIFWGDFLCSKPTARARKKINIHRAPRFAVFWLGLMILTWRHRYG